MATQGRTGYQEDIGATEETLFETPTDGNPIRGVRIEAQTAAVDVRIPLLHNTSYVTIAAGSGQDFWAPGRGIDVIYAMEPSGANAGATASWFPILG